jgi:dTDP-4-dehydrorhamnose 3,5-epimerase
MIRSAWVETRYIAQANTAFNHRRGTIREHAFPVSASGRDKIRRCTHGAILDIIVDFRPESPTYLQHIAAEFTGQNYRALYVP